MVVFRTGWDSNTESIKKICNARHIPLVYDVDDIIFEPILMKSGIFAHPGFHKEKVRSDWVEKSERQRQMLANCNAAILSTEPLAKEASRYCQKTFVLPNMLNTSMLDLADKSLHKQKPSSLDGFLRIGFAAGTNSHRQNLKVMIPPVIKVLAANPLVHLVILGPFNINSHTELTPYINQIEIIPKVTLSKLFDELHRFDINLAPLEVGNPFCETKSELRYVLASAVCVPTIASPSIPYKQILTDGISGCLAHNDEEWLKWITLLITDYKLRLEIGNTARVHAMAHFGPEAFASHTLDIYSQIFTIQ